MAPSSPAENPVRHLILIVGSALIGLFTLASSAESQGKKKKDPLPAWSDTKDTFGDPLPVGAIARIGTIRFRTNSPHMNFQPVLSNDGKYLAMSGYNDEIEIVELPAWKKIRVLRSSDLEKKNTPFFQNVAFSHDAKKIVASDGNTGNQFLLEIATGKLLKKIVVSPNKERSNIPIVALSRDEKTLL